MTDEPETPWPPATAGEMAGAYIRRDPRVGVPYVPPERIARAVPGLYYAADGKPGDIVPVVACRECARLGHICRPCRKARYYARQAAGYTTPWWWAWAIFTAVIVIAAATYWVVYG